MVKFSCDYTLEIKAPTSRLILLVITKLRVESLNDTATDYVQELGKLYINSNR